MRTLTIALCLLVTPALSFVAGCTVSVPLPPPPPPPSNILHVGANRQYITISSAVSAATDGDVIEIDAGVYANEAMTISKDITLRGVGGYAHLRWGTGDYQTNTSNIENGKGIIISRGNITLENIEFSGAKVSDRNGAGIRYEIGDLTIRNSYFHDNENGILGGAAQNNTLLIEHSMFEQNGLCSPCAHNLYIGQMGKLIFRHNKSFSARIGHTLKSRAEVNEIIGNYFSSKENTASYEAEFPNGGTVYFVGNIVEQGVNTDNPVMLGYGFEGSSNPNPELHVVNNTFYNHLGSGTFISANGSPTLTVKNNIFAGGGSIGVSADSSNLILNDADFVNVSSGDFHLSTGSSAIDGGVDPGSAGAFNLNPQWEYVEPAQKQARVMSGVAIDIGAYEFSSPTS